MSWFKPDAPNCVRHECRLQYLLECHIFSIMLTVMNSGRGCHRQSFSVEVLVLALAAKTSPDQSQAFKEVNISQVFFELHWFCFPACFLKRPSAGTPRHVCQTFRANTRRSHCVGPTFTEIE